MIETLFLTALAVLSLLVAIGPPWAYSRWRMRPRESVAAPVIHRAPPPESGAREAV